MAKAVAKVEEVHVPAPQPAVEADSLLNLIERAARDPNVDIDKMERLFGMRERMQAQAAKTAFLADLSSMQAELPAVARKGEAHNKKKYARFEDFVETIKPFMAKNGFSYTNRIDQTDTQIRVTGVLGHRAGHQETTTLVLPTDNTGNKNPVQAWGSSLAYGKRYVGFALLGIASEDEDDDGKAAGGQAKQCITEEQAEQLSKLVAKTEAPAEIGKIILQQCKADTFAEIKADRFEKIKAWLKSKFEVE
jgi:hypothetical protein